MPVLFHMLACLFFERLRERMFSEQRACRLGCQNRAHSLHLNGVAVPSVKALAPTSLEKESPECIEAVAFLSKQQWFSDSCRLTLLHASQQRRSLPLVMKCPVARGRRKWVPVETQQEYFHWLYWAGSRSLQSLLETEITLWQHTIECRPEHSWDDNEPQKLEVLDYDASSYGRHQFINCLDINEYLIPC